MKLWQKDTQTAKSVETFTVGKDRELDAEMAAFDVLGSLAHTQMLESIGLLTKARRMMASRSGDGYIPAGVCFYAYCLAE